MPGLLLSPSRRHAAPQGQMSYVKVPVMSTIEIAEEVQQKLLKLAESKGESVNDILLKTLEKIEIEMDDEADDSAEYGDTLGRVSLNEEDWALVQKALANPSYNQKMLEAMRMYDEWKATGKMPERRKDS